MPRVENDLKLHHDYLHAAHPRQLRPAQLPDKVGTEGRTAKS